MTVPAYFEIIPGITTYAKIKDIVQLSIRKEILASFLNPRCVFKHGEFSSFCYFWFFLHSLKLFSKLWPWPDMILYNIYIAFIVIPNIGLRVEGQGRGTRGVLL